MKISCPTQYFEDQEAGDDRDLVLIVHDYLMGELLATADDYVTCTGRPDEYEKRWEYFNAKEAYDLWHDHDCVEVNYEHEYDVATLVRDRLPEIKMLLNRKSKDKHGAAERSVVTDPDKLQHAVQSSVKVQHYSPPPDETKE